MKKLLVISSAPLISTDNKSYLYTPYEKEMQLWAKYAEEIQFCCPIWKADKKLLNTEITFEMLPVIQLREFNVLTFKNAIVAMPLIIKNMLTIYKAMQAADHIHLRCPGNMGLLGAIVQIFCPKKRKTAKYAGNWDPKSKQPLSYRLQKWILSNTFLTKNMHVLVYGQWPKQSKNITSFFTATYRENEIQKSDFQKSDFQNEIKFIFVGTLSAGKQPLYAIQLVERLDKMGKKVSLDIFGEGVLRHEIETYITTNKLSNIITLKGNQNKESVQKAYQQSHFLILPSKSEGWPKVVAEAMFWGCVPVATPVSCVRYMLANGERGILLNENLEKDTHNVITLIENSSEYHQKMEAAQKWSHHYTVDLFEKEIQKLLRD